MVFVLFCHRRVVQLVAFGHNTLGVEGLADGADNVVDRLLRLGFEFGSLYIRGACHINRFLIKSKAAVAEVNVLSAGVFIEIHIKEFRTALLEQL